MRRFVLSFDLDSLLLLHIKLLETPGGEQKGLNLLLVPPLVHPLLTALVPIIVAHARLHLAQGLVYKLHRSHPMAAFVRGSIL